MRVLRYAADIVAVAVPRDAGVTELQFYDRDLMDAGFYEDDDDAVASDLDDYTVVIAGPWPGSNHDRLTLRGDHSPLIHVAPDSG